MVTIWHCRRKGDCTLQGSLFTNYLDSRPLDHIVIVEKERNVTKVLKKMFGQKAADRFDSTLNQLTSLAVRLDVIQVLYSFSLKTCILFWKPSRLVDWEFSWMISPVFFEASRKSARSFWCTVDVERVGCCVGRQMGYLAFGKMVLSRLWSTSWPAFGIFGWIYLDMILAN